MNTNTLLKGALIVLICLFGTYVFMYPPSSAPNPGDEIVVHDTIKAQIDTTSVCMDFKQYHPSTLSMGLVSDMVSIYKRNQLAAIQNDAIHPVKGDASSIWFDLDTIKKFIYHIEMGVKKNGKPTDKLGLRFYYGSYPDKATWNQPGYEDLVGFLNDTLTEKYEYKHTLVLIPTIQLGSKGDNFDFNPFVLSTYTTGLPRYRNGIPEDHLQDPLMAITPSDNGSPIARPTAKNHGSLIPPGAPFGARFQ